MGRSLLLALGVGTFVAAGLWARGGGGCFEAGTLVSVPGGSAAIETLKAGDRILALDPSEHLVPAAVVQVFSLTVEEDLTVTTDSAELRVTREHPFYVGNGEFKTIGSLAPGDRVWAWSGSGLAGQVIRSITPVAHRVVVYNLQTDSPHTYFVSGIAVHNKGGGFGGGGHSFGGGGRSFGGGFHFYGSGGTGGSGTYSDDGSPPAWSIVLLILGGLGLSVWIKSLREKDEGPEPFDSPLDRKVDTPRARNRDAAVRSQLRTLGAEDRAFLPETLEPRFRETFTLLQQCWTEGNYDPLKGRLTDKLEQQHRAQLEAMRRRGEINRLDDLVIEGLWFFQVVRRSGHPAEVTVLFQARVQDYYVDEATGRFLRGDSSPESFQEFWVFRLTTDSWRLGGIEQVTDESKRWGPGVIQDPRTKDFASIADVPEPERRMGLWAQNNPVWAPGPFKEAVSALATALQTAREARSLDALDPRDFGTEVWEALEAETAWWVADDLSWEVRNFCVRRVGIVLARSRTKERAAEVLCRVATHAQTTVRRGGVFLSTDPDLKITEESWTLTLTNGRWTLTERRPYP